NTASPQDTNTVTETVDAAAPATQLTVTPISTGGADYQLRWTATDDGPGSGVKGVTIYVAVDGGDYAIWLNQSTASSAVYHGSAGHTYQFLALATDQAGNREQPPAGVDAPDDGSGANLGALPTTSQTTTDVAP